MEIKCRSSFVTKRREPIPTDGRIPPDPIPPLLKEAFPPFVTEAVIQGYGQAWAEKPGLLEEIRLRADRNASLTINGENCMLSLCLSATELFALLTRLCGGSLYAYSQHINEGFMTLSGGLRVGVVGTAACEEGKVVGVREISTLAIRLPHGHGGVGREVAELLLHMRKLHGDPRGILLYAPPGVGKTTLLRGVAARLAGGEHPLRTLVVDTRGELSFGTAGESLCLDVLSGYPRALGISIATRSMGAQVIICDEIGDSREALALLSAYHGGVPLVATAHGQTLPELLSRTGIRILHRAGLFGAYVGLRRDGFGGFVYDVTQREALEHDI